MDCLRYYCNDGAAVLWERWFHCVDLGTQLKPLIEEYFESEEHKTGKPTSVAESSPPFAVDDRTSLMSPIALKEALANANCEDGKAVTLIETPETTVTAVTSGTVPMAACDVRQRPVSSSSTLFLLTLYSRRGYGSVLAPQHSAVTLKRVRDCWKKVTPSWCPQRRRSSLQLPASTALLC